MKKNIFLLLLIPFILMACNSKKADKEAVEAGPQAQVQAETNPAVEATTTVSDNYALAGEQVEPAVPEEDLSGKPIVLTSEEFQKKITDINNPKGFQYKGKTPCIVDFYADWCRPCQMIMPMMADMAAKYKGKLIIYKINVDKAQDVAAAFGINSIPTLMFFKPNTQPQQIVGAPSAEELKTVVDKFLE